MEIRNFIFDFGKVLVDYEFVPVMDAFFGDNKEEEKEFFQTFVNKEFIDECDLEEIPFAQIIERKQAEFPRFRDALQYFYDRYLDFVIGEMPGMKQLLTELKARGYKLYGLTNWCSLVHEVIKKYDIFDLLDGYVVSSEVHLIKPDATIYLTLCSRYGLKPGECVFVDDKELNVCGAKAVGMQAVTFVSSDVFRKDLEAILGERI